MSAPKKMKSSVVAVVNGLPGNMGKEIAQACLRRGLEVADVALTGANMPKDVTVEKDDGGSVTVNLVGPGSEAETQLKEALEKGRSEGKIVVAIDFTHPSAVNRNAELYVKLGLPFVMGTTGGDREALQKVVADNGLFALIAPNMCKQIVAFQAMMDTMASTYPGAFGGYGLEITESHQSGKADTSGTAKAMVEYLNKLKGGDPFDVEDIKKLRESEAQQAFGVPAEALEGHAWHTYTLKSGDGSVVFEFKHNVCGRRTYAEGVVDAVNFLAARINEGADKKLYDMIDVLKAGEMQ
ncbi:4-hydroxy-tetrahydrodipicolinate reductase 1, chloroplastic [Hondaea fermentalgiana]|uniref:4-hydroxy-tetrahydrodipicolinate reductase n=1 Tax=Hondaea fermentalgiana TaxID=2315210 RepID=A0A2R5GJY4_9STRA|nr:4-hydroxy-tetrahydrodipicolinate reductase 1, chloroplastic [Hondaea fermentalgiana]|eukprot:GBG31187.1 4-hydroxy-tetrahydrodipicolinate reductase 1, chloroplastic [Hondaea fermentalgiana]